MYVLLNIVLIILYSTVHIDIVALSNIMVNFRFAPFSYWILKELRGCFFNLLDQQLGKCIAWKNESEAMQENLCLHLVRHVILLSEM